MPYCKHDLDEAACVTCSPPAGRSPVPELWGRWFTAAYPGDCAGCDDGIFPGDTIRADGQDGYLCAFCGMGKEEFA